MLTVRYDDDSESSGFNMHNQTRRAFQAMNLASDAFVLSDPSEASRYVTMSN